MKLTHVSERLARAKWIAQRRRWSYHPDILLSSIRPKKPADAQRARRQERLARALFATDEGLAIVGISLDSPTVQPLIAHLEQELQDREPKHYRPVLEYCGFPLGDETAQSVIQMVEMVAEKMRGEDSRRASIDKVINYLCMQNGQPVSGTEPPAAVRQGVLSLFGCITMLFKIPEDPSDTELYISEPLHPVFKYGRRPIKEARYSLNDLLTGFGYFVPGPDPGESKILRARPRKQPEPVDLDIAFLNIATLTKDLDAVPISKLLCSVLHAASMLDDRAFSEAVVAAANRSMLGETLLSYRLLFGQDAVSRAQFMDEEIKRASADGALDQLLVQLCGAKKSISSLVLDDSIREQAFYDSVFDFPFYEPRLQVLQRYTKARKSRDLRDLWHDRRDPAQWVLIWVFLTVGGITILLSVAQVGLAAAQLGSQSK
ncbi:MAG: hypothetical protein L6R40_008411 [Gallowayella cf. fulva]|nr:MAG: hypothetical protein L6R40_008411 [Xanthomendoza cf. fulva]